MLLISMALSDARVQLAGGLTGGREVTSKSPLSSVHVVSSSQSAVPTADVGICGCDLHETE